MLIRFPHVRLAVGDTTLKLMKLTSICVLAIAAQTQTLDNQTTGGAVNGRFWMSLPDDMRAALLLGFREGIVASRDFAAVKAYVSDTATIGEVKKAIDRFYDDTANLPIAVKDASRIFVMKLNGASSVSLDIEVANTRRLAALGITRIIESTGTPAPRKQ
jgi:hypothetical protein